MGQKLSRKYEHENCPVNSMEGSSCPFSGSLNYSKALTRSNSSFLGTSKNGSDVATETASNENDLLFVCDEKGYILDVNDAVNRILFYSNDAILGEFIGVIMSPHISMLHRDFFIPKYKEASKLVRNSIDSKLSSRTNHRPLLIYDVQRNPHFVYLNFGSRPRSEYNTRPGALALPEQSEYFFEVGLTLSKQENKNTHFYTKNMIDLAKKQQGFSLSKNNIVIICIDFMRSTELLEAKGPMNMAFINKRFYDDIVHIITHHFYPYISVHEVVGDSFVLVLNADWTYNLQSYCATLAINFVNRLWRASADYVDMRVGISYGKVMYGFIGPTLRFFGNPMHVASRLESQGDRGRAVTNPEFFEKLREEVKLFGEENVKILEGNASKETMLLKGYGERECYRISLSPQREDFIAIPNQ